MLKKKSKIYISGHNGLVGSAILRRLKLLGYKNLLTISKKKLDLTNEKKVFNFIKKNKPEFVINAAAKVGGILDNNSKPAEYIYTNLSIQQNIIHASFKNNVKNLIFLGSSCIYPRDAKQPIKEEYLLSGKLEKTNEPYAIAKIAGIKMCESYNLQYGTNYKCLMPCNLYGPNDNYDLKTSHFFAALISKIHQAKIKNKKKILLWGTGEPKRELMYVDDLADACIFFLEKKTNHPLINIGSGREMKIIEYAKFVMKKIGFDGKIVLDKSKPDGTPRKIIDCKIAKAYGWEAKITLEYGFDLTYSIYCKNKKK